MPAPLKTEAIVLRSIRYGEADRILHLYTPHHGRIGGDRQGRPPGPQPLRRAARAVLPRPLGAARGPRRPAHGHQRRHGGRPRRAARPRRDARRRRARAAMRWRACSRRPTPHPEVFTLLANELALLCADPSRAGPANGLAFRLKLLLAAGILPQLGGVRRVRRARAPAGLLGRGRRAWCAAPARRPRSRSTRRPTGSSSRRSGQPLAQAPAGVRARAAPGRARDRRDGRAPRHVRLRPLLNGR